jgi:hypothetical protein
MRPRKHGQRQALQPAQGAIQHTAVELIAKRHRNYSLAASRFLGLMVINRLSSALSFSPGTDQ